MNRALVLDTFAQLKGLTDTLDIELQPEPEDHGLTCTMPVDDRHTGAPGIAHGGGIAALMDTALGGAAMMYAMSLGKVCSTVELKINFLRPVPHGSRLTSRTRFLSKGRSLVVVTGEALIEGTDEPVAFASGTFNLYVHKSKA